MSEKERKIGKKLAETFDALPDNAVFEVSPIDYADHTHLIHNNKGLSAVLIALAIEAVIAFILLGVNILIATAEARRLNQKIKEQQQKE